MMRPLQPGEVGVSFLTDGGEREILPESDLKLVDRTIQPGDFCKRAIDDVQSGVVTNVQVKGRIDHVISGESVEGWKTLSDLESKVDPEIGDYVLYNDWIGQVAILLALVIFTHIYTGNRGRDGSLVELCLGEAQICAQLYDESLIEVSTGELVRLPELSSRLAVGEKGTVSIVIFYHLHSINLFLITGHSPLSFRWHVQPLWIPTRYPPAG